jgi:vancomycin resistance protein YoaR
MNQYPPRAPAPTTSGSGLGSATGTSSTRARSGNRGSVYLGIAGGLLVAAGGMFGAYFVTTHRDQRAHAATESPAPVKGKDGVVPAGALDLDAALAREVEVIAAGQKTRVRWADLGAVPDTDELTRARGSLEDLAKAGRLPIKIDRQAALAALSAVKSKLDRGAIDAYLDLEARKVVPEAPGMGLDVLGSLPRLEAAARTGAPTLELAVVPVPARVTRDSLGIDDISNVLGTYTTKFSVSDKERNFNLKLAASKVNGFVMKPGEEFSFNAIVGDRTEKEGYKVAHVITAGEMVDGLAGGTCQISTTLFAASFFAGLDVVKQSPHSRPSVYAPLGLDATVVYPTTDLKLKNSYDFPVVIHYRVARGEALVEILGKPRPYDKIVFEGEVLEETPYPTEERLDELLATGLTTTDQPGFNGYKIKRDRKFIKDGKTVKTDHWTVVYKPVTEYIRVGTNTAPDAKQLDPDAKPMHMPKVPSDEPYSMSQ